jgi:hypothetical protein
VINSEIADEAEKTKVRVKGVCGSISFPSNLYAALGKITEQKKASLACLMRDAPEKHVAGLTVVVKEPTRRK